jgi:hypothetical protein
MTDRRLNEPEGGSDERCDGLIRDALTPLRSVGMPSGVRASTERRIHASLAGDVTCRDGLWKTWWRYRVSVPVPVAAGLVLFLALLGILQLWQLSHHHTLGEPEVVATPGPAATRVSRPQHYEAALYVTGMGFVQSERGYRFFEENNHEIR